MDKFSGLQLVYHIAATAADTARRYMCGIDRGARRTQLLSKTSIRPKTRRILQRTLANQDMPLARLQRTIDAVESIIKLRPNASWSFTGWSLGGGLALHCGQYFKKPAVAIAPLITSPTVLQWGKNVVVNDIDDTVYRLFCFRARATDACKHIKAHAGDPPWNHMLGDIAFAVFDSAVMKIDCSKKRSKWAVVHESIQELWRNTFGHSSEFEISGGSESNCNSDLVSSVRFASTD